MEVYLLTHIVHNRSDVWENPTNFDPDRFQDTKIKERDPYQYVPFSAGPRNCIGQHFALDEIKVILIKVVQKFKVRVDPTNEAVCEPVLVMRPKENGVHVFFSNRKMK